MPAHRSSFRYSVARASMYAAQAATRAAPCAILLRAATVIVLAVAARPVGAQVQRIPAADTTAGTRSDLPQKSDKQRTVTGADTSRRTLLGSAYITLGGNGLPLGTLDTRLRAAGLPGTPSGSASLGSGAYAIVARRLVVGASGHLLMAGRTERAGWQTRVGGGYALGELGVAAVATSHTILAVTGGLGASRVTAKLRPLDGGRFDSVAVAPRRSLELGSHTVLVHAGVMADHVMRWRGGRAIVVGMRAGWMGDVGNSAWRADDAALAGGPTIAPRGPYARISLGAPIGRRRDALLPALGPAIPWLAR